MSKDDRLSRAVISDRALQWTTRHLCLVGLLTCATRVCHRRQSCGLRWCSAQCRVFRGDRLLKATYSSSVYWQPARRLRHPSVHVTQPFSGVVQLTSTFR